MGWKSEFTGDWSHQEIGTAGFRRKDSEGRFVAFDAILHEDPDSGGAYIIYPWDIRKEFGKGRVKDHATFDGVPYDGSIVNEEMLLFRCVSADMSP